MAHNPEDCGGAWLVSLELAAFLSWHGWSGKEVVVVGWLLMGDMWKGGNRDRIYIYLRPRLTRPSNIVLSCAT